MSKNTLTDLANSPKLAIAQTQGVGGILARLWRIILYDRYLTNQGRYNLSLLDSYCQEYVRRQQATLTTESASNYINAGNLRRELYSPKHTWRTFIKALKVIQVNHLKITVTLTFKNGQRTEHFTEVKLAEVTDDGE